MTHTEAELVPVFTGTLQNQSVQLCNARDLHVFLKSGQDFSDWIKNRIKTYGFIEGEDFSINLGKTSKGAKGGRPTTDYHLTLDTAKELAMVENNDQGRMVRRYFIALEKRLPEQAQPAAESATLSDHRHITPAQAEEISTLICGLFPGHLERAGAWRRFKANFKIHSYRRLPAHKFDEAITFIESTDARRRNEFGREGGQSSSHLALRDIGPQIDLAALSRQVAEYLMHENRDDNPTIGGQTDLAKIEALLNETMEQFNSLPNGLIYQNLHAVMSLLKKGKSKANRLQGVRRLELPQLKSSLQSDLVQFMRELDLPCVEIGLYEIEVAAAGRDLGQLPLEDLAGIAAKALTSRPEHMADIQLVSGWIFAEVNSTDAKRDGIRQQWLDVARRIEDALS